MRGLAALVVVVLSAFAPRHTQAQTSPPAEPPSIQDNSFLLEEAYNQERGVVQHISAFARGEGGWFYAFTQEWPVPSVRHQLSATFAVQNISRDSDDDRGIGDLSLNYRYQLVGDGQARLAISPRISLLIPTGNSDRELGAGATGVQLNLPVSVVVAPRFVTHWNAGVTSVPRSKNVFGERADTTRYNLGESTIWQATRAFNVLVEISYESSETVTANDETAREHSLLVSPGVRWAHNLESGLQIVPGVAAPLGVGPSRGDRGVFLYLSFEHPFRRP